MRTLAPCWCLLVIGLVGCGSSSDDSAFSSGSTAPGPTATQPAGTDADSGTELSSVSIRDVIGSSRQALADEGFTGYTLAAVSNSGQLLGTAVGDTPIFVNDEGAAGQWVTEWILDQPVPVTGPSGEAGFSYTALRVTVTPGSTDVGPSFDLAVPSEWSLASIDEGTVPDQLVWALAVAKNAYTGQWAVRTITMDPPTTSRPMTWIVRFYPAADGSIDPGYVVLAADLTTVVDIKVV